MESVFNETPRFYPLGAMLHLISCVMTRVLFILDKVPTTKLRWHNPLILFNVITAERLFMKKIGPLLRPLFSEVYDPLATAHSLLLWTKKLSIAK